ncbi:MAG: DUF2058 domain-containing protein [Candidatus Sedimenticola endophacoides]
MGNSLQDQLLGAGLVDQKRVNKAKKAKQQKEKAQRHQRHKTPDESARLAGERAAEAARRDRQLNEQRHQAAERKALEARIRQLIETNRLPSEAGDIAYHFSVDGKLRRIHVDAAQQGRLSRGALAVVTLDDAFHLVPADVAEKIAAQAPERVVARNDPAASEDAGDDDPYAEFQVPDDLMW